MKKNHIFTLLLLAVTSFFCSCADMNENVDKWLDGEIVYGAKVDSVHAYAGKNRIKLDLFVSSQRIDKILIYWDNMASSKTIEVNNKAGVYSTILENMKEKDYLFQIYTFDQYGNRSLRTDANGASYGEEYEKSLISRTYDKSYSHFDPSSHTLEIYWGNAIDGATALRISYIDTEGNPQVKDIDLQTKYTKVEDIASNCNILTDYEPNKMIDIFSATSKLPLYYEQEIDKSDWKVIALSSEWGSDGRFAKNTIDGSLETSWHTAIGGAQRTQHWFIVDMGKDYDVTRFGVYGPMDPMQFSDQVYENNYDLKFAADGELSDTSDPNDAGWKRFGSYTLIQGEKRELVARKSTNAKARYFMFYMKYGNKRDGICSLTEINAYMPMSENYIK